MIIRDIFVVFTCEMRAGNCEYEIKFSIALPKKSLFFCIFWGSNIKFMDTVQK